jgi:hypothetical protein
MKEIVVMMMNNYQLVPKMEVWADKDLLEQ